MRRSLWVYGGIFALLMGAAYMRWSSPDEQKSKSTDIVVLDARNDEVSRIFWHEEKSDALLELKQDDLGSYAWVSVVERKAVKKTEEAVPPPKEDLATAKPEEYEETRTAFKGGEAADKLVDGFKPFKAKRLLGSIPPEKLKDLGLETPESWLEITRKGQVRRFDVGGETYGAKDRYLRDSESGKIYLIAGDSLRPLNHAKSRLPDRSLSSVKTEKLVKVRLTGSTGSVDMIQGNREDKDKAFWASAAAPEESVPMYATWLDKVLKLKSLNYLQETEIPKDLAPLFQLSLASEGAKPETVEFLQGTNEKGELDYYARGNYLRALVKLQRTVTADAAADVPAVLAARPGEDLPEDEKAKEAEKAREGAPAPHPMGAPPRPMPSPRPPVPGGK